MSRIRSASQYLAAAWASAKPRREQTWKFSLSATNQAPWRLVVREAADNAEEGAASSPWANWPAAQRQRVSSRRLDVRILRIASVLEVGRAFQCRSGAKAIGIPTLAHRLCRVLSRFLSYGSERHGVNNSAAIHCGGCPALRHGVLKRAANCRTV